VSDKIKGAVIGALLLLLALALIGDFFLYHGYTGEKSRADKAETNLATANKATEDANAATKTCNDSIAGLADAAKKAGFAAGEARERARKKSLALEGQAQTELSTPATVPGNDCKSAQDRVTRILKERAKP
jgi:F0F1-type ATP synthase membrane subunit b/b'